MAFMVVLILNEAFYAVRLWWWKRTGHGTCTCAAPA
jgi:hypothetical protein